MIVYFLENMHEITYLGCFSCLDWGKRKLYWNTWVRVGLKCFCKPPSQINVHGHKVVRD